jgi:hypothetical protein
MYAIGLCHSRRSGDENEPQTLWIGEELVEKWAGEKRKGVLGDKKWCSHARCRHYNDALLLIAAIICLQI